MSDKPLKRSLEAFLKMLRRSARNHNNGLRHYTTMTSFVRMQDSGQAYFSLLPNSNDGGEYESNRHYMMCFSFGKEENIALWSLYGVPHYDSICLTFPRRDIMEWFESAKEGGLSFYGLEDKRRSVLLNDACPKVSICDVAYYGNGIFTHNGKNYCLTNDGITGIESYKGTPLAPYVKKWAWSYEREVRILLEFDKPVLNSNGKPYGRIAVDFDEPLQLLREGRGEIRLGPWCRRSAETVRKKGFSKANIVSSEFKGLIRFPSPCSVCDVETRKSCKCKHKNMM